MQSADSLMIYHTRKGNEAADENHPDGRIQSCGEASFSLARITVAPVVAEP